MNNLTWKSVKLVNLREEMEEEYIKFLYTCYQDLKSRCLFTNDMYVRSLTDFVGELKKKIYYKYHEFMIVLNINNNQPIGFVYTYKYSPNDGTLYETQYIRPQQRGSIYGIETSLVFMEYLFNRYSIRKIYCSTYSYNNASISILESAGFKLEGKLKQSKYYNSKYHDMLIYALYKKDFETIRNKLKK